MTLVSGQVLDHAGHPLPGVVVYATPVGGRRFVPSPMSSTDLSGRWAFDLGPGEWRVREVGFASHMISVADTAIRLGEEQATQFAPDPTTEDIERLLARHKQVRVTEEDTETVEPPVTRIGDVAAFLRERRGE